MEEIHIHNHHVNYEDNAYSGADYLMRHLDRQEADVFFNQAKYKGHIKFEDVSGKNYTLVHHNGAYIIKH